MITYQMLKKAGLSPAKAFLVHIKFPNGATKDELLKAFKGTTLEADITTAVEKITEE